MYKFFKSEKKKRTNNLNFLHPSIDWWRCTIFGERFNGIPPSDPLEI